jgi:hypothetical protein
MSMYHESKNTQTNIEKKRRRKKRKKERIARQEDKK